MLEPRRIVTLSALLFARGYALRVFGQRSISRGAQAGPGTFNVPAAEAPP